MLWIEVRVPFAGWCEVEKTTDSVYALKKAEELAKKHGHQKVRVIRPVITFEPHYKAHVHDQVNFDVSNKQ